MEKRERARTRRRAAAAAAASTRARSSRRRSTRPSIARRPPPPRRTSRIRQLAGVAGVLCRAAPRAVRERAVARERGARRDAPGVGEVARVLVHLALRPGIARSPPHRPQRVRHFASPAPGAARAGRAGGDERLGIDLLGAGGWPAGAAAAPGVQEGSGGSPLWSPLSLATLQSGLAWERFCFPTLAHLVCYRK